MIVTSGAMKNFRGTVKKVLRYKQLVMLEVPLMGRIVEVKEVVVFWRGDTRM